MTWPNESQQKKKKKITCRIVDFADPDDHRVKLKEGEKKDKFLNLARGLKRSMEHEGDGDTNCNLYSRYNKQMFVKGTEGVGKKKMSGDLLNDSIIKIFLNTKKDSWRLKEIWCHSNFSEKPSPGVKNFQMSKLTRTF